MLMSMQEVLEVVPIEGIPIFIFLHTVDLEISVYQFLTKKATRVLKKNYIVVWHCMAVNA